jgi:hypothetical protein
VKEYTEAELRRMLQGLDSWIPINDKELDVVDDDEEHDYRFYDKVITIIRNESTGEVLGVEWLRALCAASHDDEFPWQPYLVESYEEVIPEMHVTRWKKKGAE